MTFEEWMNEGLLAGEWPLDLGPLDPAKMIKELQKRMEQAWAELPLKERYILNLDRLYPW